MEHDQHIRALAQLHVLLGADDDAINLEGDSEHVLGRDDGMGLGDVSESVSVRGFVRRGAHGLEHVHPYFREPVAERRHWTRNSHREVSSRPYVSRVEAALHHMRESKPAHFVRHQAALVKGAVKALRDPKVSKGRKAAIAAALALLVGATAFPLLGPLDDVIAVGALKAATSPGRPGSKGRAAKATLSHVSSGLGGHVMPPPSELLALERRLGEARRRRETSRGGDEWTRARAEELALEEALFGIGGTHYNFNPNRHPRDRGGKFAQVLGGLKHGDTVHLPGGVAVTRLRHGYKVRHRRDLAPDVGRVDVGTPEGAAAMALKMDPTPRENDRIEGVRHRKGDELTRRDVHGLAPGTAVVAGGKEYGRFRGIVRDGSTREPYAEVEFDHPTEGKKITRRFATNRLALAHPTEQSPDEIAQKLPQSPGRSAYTAAHINPGGDALHFLDHIASVMDQQNEQKKRELDQRIARTMGRPRGSRVADPQLRRAGIVPSAG